MTRTEQSARLRRRGHGGKTTAGTRVGPATPQETIVELAAQAPKAIYDAATGDVPMSPVLSIPGYTQIQYSYRGIPDEADVSRTFRIKGKLELTREGARMTLAIDGELEAPRTLPIEYQVNFKTTKRSFPTWTPFRDGAGIARRSGKRTTYRHAVETVQHTVRHPDTNRSVTIEYERRTAYARDDQQKTAFATFFEDGTKRDGKKMWHDYEYYWSAYKYEPAADEDGDSAAGTEFESDILRSADGDVAAGGAVLRKHPHAL